MKSKKDAYLSKKAKKRRILSKYLKRKDFFKAQKGSDEKKLFKFHPRKGKK